MPHKIDEIGTLFLKRRKELGLTQQQLGERVGVSKSEISKIENGRGITFATINKLSEALGVSPEVELRPKTTVSPDVIQKIFMSGISNFEFLVEYISAKVIGWIIEDQNLSAEDAILLFHNSETFEKLCQKNTDLYIESPAYVYEIFNEEMKRGTIRGLTD